MKMIRNFSIIAHIDHGKSTLSDQLIQRCGGLTKREMVSQVLDSMDLERERGITIKAQNVTLNYIAKNKKKYQLNFIDTPGHVNFEYEVSRSLSACEGAMLVIDAAQGVEAQTVAHCNMALKMNLKILPVINKIDLPHANPTRVIKDIEKIIGISTKNIVLCSAKTGKGISNLLEKIVKYIPKPKGCPKKQLQALVIDSWFDKYLGVVSLICIKNGTLQVKDQILMMNTKKKYFIEEMGIFTPKRIKKKTLYCGEVGWIICGIKNISSILVGETLTSYQNPTKKKLVGFKKISPKIFAGLYPLQPDKFNTFRDALKKLQLNDSSLFYETENSDALGFGFRCGFLGLLHMEIVQSRIEREYNIEIISTTPTVIYELLLNNKKIKHFDNPSKFPKINTIKEIREPIAKCNILTPIKYVGNIIQLCIKKRGIQKDITYFNEKVNLSYELPLSEVISNFFDKIKEISSGYASLEYKFYKFKKSDLIPLYILINSVKIDALTTIIHKNNAYYYAHKTIEIIKKLLPRHQFDIPIQAAIYNKIISRTTVKQLRKNVLSKCYGGDISRKKKLLKKQKEGKKKMKKIGNVNIPKEIFFSLLKI